MFTRRTTFLLLVLGATLGLYLFSRTQRGSALVDAAVSFLGDLMTPRGIRNNNPGNIERNAIVWQGAVTREALQAAGVDYDPVYVQFDTAANGVRAIGHVLRAKAARGLTTVDAIIRDYSQTDQDAYVANVADALGVDPERDTIDVTARLPELALAIINQENGEQPYDATDVAQWVYT